MDMDISRAATKIFICIFYTYILHFGGMKFVDQWIGICSALVDITCFPMWIYQLQFYQQYMRAPSTPHPHSHMVLSSLF